jgi:putative resolvase
MTLRPKEVRQRLGISYVTLREYVKKGYIKPVLETGKWRFREEDIEKLMGIVRKRFPTPFSLPLGVGGSGLPR